MDSSPQPTSQDRNWDMRPKDEDKAFMKKLIDRTGLDRSNVIRLALRNEALRLGVDLEKPAA